MDQQSAKLENSPLSPLNKLIKHIWYVALAVGAAAIMLQDKFVFKEIFWAISISILILAFSCVVMLFKGFFSLVERVLYTIATIVLMVVHLPSALSIVLGVGPNYQNQNGMLGLISLRS